MDPSQDAPSLMSHKSPSSPLALGHPPLVSSVETSLVQRPQNKVEPSLEARAPHRPDTLPHGGSPLPTLAHALENKVTNSAVAYALWYYHTLGISEGALPGPPDFSKDSPGESKPLSGAEYCLQDASKAMKIHPRDTLEPRENPWDAGKAVGRQSIHPLENHPVENALTSGTRNHTSPEIPSTLRSSHTTGNPLAPPSQSTGNPLAPPSHTAGNPLAPPSHTTGNPLAPPSHTTGNPSGKTFSPLPPHALGASPWYCPERPTTPRPSDSFIPHALAPSMEDIPRALKSPREREFALGALREKMKGYKDLAIAQTAKNMVFSDGNPHAAIVLVGEAPGAEEDLQGKPFVGPSGKLLDAMLASIGLDRSCVYIVNVVPWRPPFNRQPTGEEIKACLCFLQEHISIISPRLMVCVGGVATKTLLNLPQTLTQSQGQAWSYTSPFSPAPIPTWTLYHPAYLMRSPGQKKVAWQQLQCIQAFLKDMGLVYGSKNSTIPQFQG